MSNNFYVVYFVDDLRARIFATLDEVKQAMEGRPSFYRQFSSKEEADTWRGRLRNSSYEMDEESQSAMSYPLADWDFTALDLEKLRCDWNMDADELERKRQNYERQAAGINFLYIVCWGDKDDWFASYNLVDIQIAVARRVANIYPFPVNDPALKELGFRVTDSTVWDICKSTGEDPWLYMDYPIFDKSLCSCSSFEVGCNPDGTSWLKTYSELPAEKRA